MRLLVHLLPNACLGPSEIEVLHATSMGLLWCDLRSIFTPLIKTLLYGPRLRVAIIALLDLMWIWCLVGKSFGP